MHSRPTIAGPFAEALRDGRDLYNARFETARRRFRALDPRRVAALLAAVGDPVVRAVHAHDSSRARATSDAVYDVMVELVGTEVDARDPSVADTLRACAPAFAAAIAREPRRTLAQLANATARVSLLGELARSTWQARLLSVAQATRDDSTRLDKALVVAAWTCGAPMLRPRAMVALRELPPAVALSALGLARCEIPLEVLVARLEADPWSTPSRLARGELPSPRFTRAAWIGGFRAFSGAFREPPKVERVGRFLRAYTRHESYVLWADWTGAYLEPWKANAPGSSDTEDDALSLDIQGRMLWRGLATPEPVVPLPVASWASCGKTLLVVPARSHFVGVFAVAEST